MAAHSSILAWTIPWTEEPGGLRSTGSQRSLAGYGPRGRKELDTTERLTPSQIAVLYRSLQTTPDAGPEAHGLGLGLARGGRGAVLYTKPVSVARAGCAWVEPEPRQTTRDIGLGDP